MASRPFHILGHPLSRLSTKRKTPDEEIIRTKKTQISTGFDGTEASEGDANLLELPGFLLSNYNCWEEILVNGSRVLMGFCYGDARALQQWATAPWKGLCRHLFLPLLFSRSALSVLVWEREVRFEWGFCLVEECPFCYKWVAHSDGRSTPLPKVSISILDWKILTI